MSEITINGEITLEKAEDTAIEITNEASGDAVGMLGTAEAFEVVSQQLADEATVVVREVKTRIRGLEKARRFIVDPLNAHVKNINEMFKPSVETYRRVEKVYKNKVQVWLVAEEQKRLDAERKAREIAEKERLRKEKLAKRAEDRGNEELAEKHRDEAEEIPEVVVEQTAETAEGSYMVETWSAEIADLAKLVEAVHKGTVPAEAIVPDMKWLNNVAKSLKGSMKYPGVKVTSKKEMRVRV